MLAPSADSPDEAGAFILANTHVGPDERLNVEHGAEDVLNEQYGGIAFLTGEAS